LKIDIDSLHEVIRDLDFIKRNNINLISIRDTNPSIIESKAYDTIDRAGLKNLLVVPFDDLVEPLPKEYNREERPPEEQDIRIILEWAKKKMQENNNDFVVQCTAGVSRSSAVAILVQYLQDPAMALKVINPMFHSPNEKVLEIGEKLLNTKDIKEPAKKLMKEYDAQWKENLGNNPL